MWSCVLTRGWNSPGSLVSHAEPSSSIKAIIWETLETLSHRGWVWSCSRRMLCTTRPSIWEKTDKGKSEWLAGTETAASLFLVMRKWIKRRFRAEWIKSNRFRKRKKNVFVPHLSFSGCLRPATQNRRVEKISNKHWTDHYYNTIIFIKTKRKRICRNLSAHFKTV